MCQGKTLFNYYLLPRVILLLLINQTSLLIPLCITGPTKITIRKTQFVKFITLFEHNVCGGHQSWRNCHRKIVRFDSHGSK
ncbi:hypothetical protein VNO78_15798 [Psophocarpus tetragonolobus]|uniref:Uncharacterized protein n=1 Tax=Psophocarpus tetragonolobus TaxID=3891 RepID=A0AAN9XK86_PSOTE